MKLEHEDTTPVEGQDPPDENAHSMTDDCDVKTSASVDNQTPGDAIINTDDNDKDMALKSEDDNDKAHESPPVDSKDLVESSSAAKTNNGDASVVDATANQLFSTQNAATMYIPAIS
ncbi:hypothetical protein ACOSQ4_017930 [Xanthoceras sorbifolium]